MRWLGLLGGFLVACGGDSGSYVYMDDDLPSENCPATEAEACATTSGPTSASSVTTTGANESTGGSTGECDSTRDCARGFCAAPFDGDVGEFACMPGCIGDMDEASWCADAAACCSADAVCTDRGYCVPSGAEGGSTSGGDSSDNDSGSDSGGSDSDSSDSGDSGSSTGG